MCGERKTVCGTGVRVPVRARWGAGENRGLHSAHHPIGHIGQADGPVADFRCDPDGPDRRRAPGPERTGRPAAVRRASGGELPGSAADGPVTARGDRTVLSHLPVAPYGRPTEMD
ncbi:hypothetical protein GCM10009639_41590 [Kitasatospora putterlickiae]|uniref:Uncharacterized protein n=1 Tax=Kitasatospora putterlickiae TaxID=221725 RepID=A0ABN1Y819_9ACTN